MEVLETYLEPHGHPFINGCFKLDDSKCVHGKRLLQKKHPFKNWLFKVLDTRKLVCLLFKPRDSGFNLFLCNRQCMGQSHTCLNISSFWAASLPCHFNNNKRSFILLMEEIRGSPVEVGSLSPSISKVLAPSQVVFSPDF